MCSIDRAVKASGEYRKKCMNSRTATLGNVTEDELARQPEIRVRAIALPPDQLGLLPQPGEQVIVIGCGTSNYIGDSIAYLRDDPGSSRTRAAISTELTREHVQEHHDAGFQIATHAFGDRAIGATIDVYRAVGPPTTPAAAHSIAHLECPADRDLATMTASGITAAMQSLDTQWRQHNSSDRWLACLG